MDTISDILSTFFVSKNNKIQKQSNKTYQQQKSKEKESPIKELSNKINIKQLNQNKNNVNKKDQETQVELDLSDSQLKTHIETQLKKIFNSDKRSLNKISSELNSNKNPSAKDTNSNSSSSSSSSSSASAKDTNSSAKDTNSSAKDINSSAKDTNSSPSSSPSANDTNASSSSSAKDTNPTPNPTPNSTSSSSSKDTTKDKSNKKISKYNNLENSKKSLSNSIKIKKCIMKNDLYYKRNLIIMNSSLHKNLKTLNNILYDQSLIDECKNLYNNNIYVACSSDNKSKFKKMFDENPYLYFTDFNIKMNFSKKTIDSFADNNNKKTIFIVDDSLENSVYEKLLNRLVNYDDIKIIFIVSSFSLKMYNHIKKLINESILLIFENNDSSSDKLKFYNNIIKKLFSYIEFSTIKNYEKFIIKDQELRYY